MRLLNNKGMSLWGTGFGLLGLLATVAIILCLFQWVASVSPHSLNGSQSAVNSINAQTKQQAEELFNAANRRTRQLDDQIGRSSEQTDEPVPETDQKRAAKSSQSSHTSSESSTSSEAVSQDGFHEAVERD